MVCWLKTRFTDEIRFWVYDPYGDGNADMQKEIKPVEYRIKNTAGEKTGEKDIELNVAMMWEMREK